MEETSTEELRPEEPGTEELTLEEPTTTEEPSLEKQSSIQVVVAPNQVDDALVEAAYGKITNIFSEHLEKAITEAGEYLYTEFYDGDIERARTKKSPKQETLNQLIKKLQGSTSDTPSKSWIYNAIGLVVQEYDVKCMKENIQNSYKRISLTHKVKLLPVPQKEKGTLIKKIDAKKLTVKALVSEIAKLKAPQEKRLLTILNNYEEILNEENAERLNIEAFKKEPLDKLDGIKTRIASKVENAKNDLENLNKSIKRHEQYIEKYDTISLDVEKALEYIKNNGEPLTK